MKLDNKKLVKVLVISGVGLLIIFILVRLALKTSGDRVTEMPTIGELKYEPAKVKEESKVEQFEEQKKEIDRKAMGYDNSQYVIPNFNNLLDKKDNSVIQQSSANNSPATFNAAGKNVSYRKPASSQSPAGPATSQYKTSSSAAIAPIPPKAGIPGKAGTKKESPQNSKLNYHSDYFNNNNETTPVAQEAPKTENAASSRNPFGTITSDNNQGQKQTANQPVY